MKIHETITYSFENIPKEYVEYLAHLLEYNPFEDQGHKELPAERNMREELFNLFRTDLTTKSMLTKEDVFNTTEFMGRLP